MSRSVDLPDSVYAALEAAATSSGTTPVGWIAERLPQPAPASRMESEGSPSSTLAERFAGLVGGFRSGRGDLSEHHSELYAEGVVEKHRVRQFTTHHETASDTSVHLPARIFTALQEAALASGTTPVGWIAASLPTSDARPDDESAPPGMLAERLAGLVGLVRSGRNDLAERHSELFMEGMVEKQATGHL
jgi:hypothetical protein